MIAAKAEQKKRDQTRLSRKATRIFISVILVGLLAFVCFPDKPKAATDEESPNTAVSDAHREDLKFAIDLIQYVQPETQGKPPQSSPVPEPPNQSNPGCERF